MESGRIVGHILFSPVRIDGSEMTTDGMGLAPVAVLPAWQRQGIGTLLVQTGIKMLTGQGCSFTIVLGHPEYYPRFGFERASLHGIHSQWQGVPDEAFMILILDEAAMAGVQGMGQVWERIR